MATSEVCFGSSNKQTMNLLRHQKRIIEPIVRSPCRQLSVSCVRRDIFKVQDEKDFKEKVLKSKEPVIVDFFATWCNPCKILMPRLEVAVGSTKGAVHLAKVDVDEQESLAAEYDVSALPTVIAIKNGKVVDQFVGLKDEDVIDTFVAKLT